MTANQSGAIAPAQPHPAGPDDLGRLRQALTAEPPIHLAAARLVMRAVGATLVVSRVMTASAGVVAGPTARPADPQRMLRHILRSPPPRGMVRSRPRPLHA